MENKIITADIAVIGASLGGTLAAYSAAKQGKKVLLFEETDWIGGQLTTQAIPPDEHKYIEQTGCTKSYREYRNKVRDYYRNHPYIIEELKTKEFFCPASSTVSRISHPPKLALKILNGMLQPYVNTGLIKIFYNTKVVSCVADKTEIKNVTLKTLSGTMTVKAEYYLDGTDTGELIKFSGAEYVCGAESFAQTKEKHAPINADNLDMQPINWAAAIRNIPKGDYVIDKPYRYDYFKRLIVPYDNKPLLSMFGPDSSTGRAKKFGMFNGETDKNGERLFGLFAYRRIVCAANFKDNFEPYDITVINWPQNDYYLNNIFDTQDDAYNIEMSKQLTLSLVYYLQTEAERADGKKGYRGFQLYSEPLGTVDGLAKAPYIRESRRIKSLFTVTENAISKGGNAAFFDSVGVGSYPIDLHITTKSHSFFYADSELFTIPLGSMIPVKMSNLLPACKNIGVTHITNGCFRLHPVEWNIGESAGFIAAYCLDNNINPKDIYSDKQRIKGLQNYLSENGIQLYW